MALQDCIGSPRGPAATTPEGTEVRAVITIA
jgi:hypothetical protein